MASGDPVKLQAQLHKLEATLVEVTRDRDAKAKELDRVKDLNRRGDAELRKAESIISSSREAKNVSLVIEERDTLMQQVRGLQEMIRGILEENEKYKKLIAEGSAAETNSKAKQAEAQDRINRLRAEIKEAEGQLAALEAASVDAPGTPGEEYSALTAKIAALRVDLSCAEEEAEVGASEAVKATRARERMERENREKLSTLEGALEAKIRENATLMEKMSDMESAHGRDLETFIGKLNERETELADARGQLKAATDSVEAFKTQLEDMRRKSDDEIKKAVEKAVEKTKTEMKGKAVDESVVTEYKIKLEAAQLVAKELTLASSELQNAKDSADALVQQLRQKVINREQKLSEAIQAKSILQTELQDLRAEATSLEKGKDKAKKELKSVSETLKQVRAEFERVSTELGKVSSAREDALLAIEDLKTQLRFATAEANELKEALSESQELAETRGKAIEQLELVVATSEARLDELKAQFNIAVKLTKQMNLELRTQLQDERRRVMKLERDIQRLGTQHTTAPASPMLNSAQSPARPVLALSAPVAPRSSAMSGPSPPTNQQNGSTGARPPVKSSGDASRGPAEPNDDTIRLLGQRLQGVLADAEVAREKVRFLEQSIQILTQELEGKKLLIKQLTASNTSASIDELDSETSRAIGAAMRGDDSLNTMRLLLEKSMTENARLKRDMKVLGAELVASKPTSGEEPTKQEEPGSAVGNSAHQPVPTAPNNPFGHTRTTSNPFGTAPTADGNPFGAPPAVTNPFGK